MNDLLNILPPKYRPWLIAAALASPYVTRAFHSLRNGGGLKGVLAAIWLGTNTPRPTDNTQEKP